MTEATKTISLVRKLANVLGNSERVAKNGFNKFHNYAYATEADISASVRTEMAKQGLMMIPTVESIEWQVVETNGGKKEKLCTVHWLFTLLDADSAEKIEFRNVGQGQDSGDKAFYKAATGALKYALKMLFLIPTGDDPETDSPEGVVVDPKVEAAAAAQKVKEQAERAAGIQKMVSAFAAIGVDAAALDKLAGGPVASIGNETWSRLRKEFEPLKKAHDAAPPLKADARPLDPEEEARRQVREQAEKSLGDKSITFANCVDRIRDAKTEEECVLVEADFVGMKPTPTKGDLAAMARASKDRRLVLAEKKRPKPRVEDDKSGPSGVDGLPF